MESTFPSCTVGIITEDECHKTVYCRSRGLHLLRDKEETYFKLLSLRVGASAAINNDEATICNHHDQKYINQYEKRQWKCADPFKSHRKSVISGLQKISLGNLETMNQNLALLQRENKVTVLLKPGEKLCSRCFKRITSYKEGQEDNSVRETNASRKVDEKSASDEELNFAEVEQSALNRSLQDLPSTLSPIRATRVSSHHKISYGKRKLEQINKEMAKKLSKCLGINVARSGELMEEEKECDGCKDLEEIIRNIQEKMPSASRNKKIQLLTILPTSWKKEQIKSTFGVTDYIVRQARALKKEKGILAEPEKRHRTGLNPSTIQKVLEFYKSEEYTRIMPGAKDCVSVKDSEGNRVLQQKRLLLLNLNEMYQEFKNTSPEHKIGVSKFCSLRPKNCITVGARGTHSVCVCVIHENVKLMIPSFPSTPTKKVTYEDLISKSVCSLQSPSCCMLHGCPRCPGKEGVSKYLESCLEEDIDWHQNIIFKQWITTDRTTLEYHSLELADFIDKLCEKIEKLSSHHFIAKNQSRHLNNLKTNLKENECIMILDFSENYSFVIQDAAQGYHWDTSQATLHPFVMYFSADNTTQHKSFCVISDWLKHDTVSVYTYQKALLKIVAEKYPQIKTVYYWSDGAAAQYKNFKNFINLLHHFEDFGLEAEWHFFATSHGKNACDGVGGTIKREAYKASLQVTQSGDGTQHRPHIMTPLQLYEFCKYSIKTVDFIFITESDVKASEENLKERFQSADKIPGTRIYHFFKPVDCSKMRIAPISGNKEMELEFSQEEMQTNQLHLKDLKIGEFVACLYMKQWWIGNITDVSEEHEDIFVNFLHPHGPFPSFTYPERKDEFWIPPHKVLAVISVPSLSSSGRFYTITADDIEKIESAIRLK